MIIHSGIQHGHDILFFGQAGVVLQRVIQGHSGDSGDFLIRGLEDGAI